LRPPLGAVGIALIRDAIANGVNRGRIPRVACDDGRKQLRLRGGQRFAIGRLATAACGQHGTDQRDEQRTHSFTIHVFSSVCVTIVEYAGSGASLTGPFLTDGECDCKKW
jgi:hypothetical protein